jgi:thiol-disulfide isomerase/thioredoxin
MSAPKNQAARARAAGGHRPPTSRSRSLVPIIGVVVVLVVAVAIALAVSGDDGDSDDGGTMLATAGITVRGTPLPPRPQGGEDPAVGAEAPTLEGVAPDGTPTAVEPDGEPTLVAFLAHWCPACQEELPHLVELAGDGSLDGVRTVLVLTGTDSARPNHPPGRWLQREGWQGESLLDDQGSPAADAYGLTSYPYLVLLDGDGQVTARSSGVLGASGLRAFVSQAG